MSAEYTKLQQVVKEFDRTSLLFLQRLQHITIDLIPDGETRRISRDVQTASDVASHQGDATSLQRGDITLDGVAPLPQSAVNGSDGLEPVASRVASAFLVANRYVAAHPG